MTEPLAFKLLGLHLSEKQIPQVVENLESGGEPKEALERAVLRPRQVRYRAALRPDSQTAPFILTHTALRLPDQRIPQEKGA